MTCTIQIYINKLQKYVIDQNLLAVDKPYETPDTLYINFKIQFLYDLLHNN